MTRLIVNSNTPQAAAFIEYASKLPFVEIDGNKKKRTLAHAIEECGGAYSPEEFCDGVLEITKTMKE